MVGKTFTFLLGSDAAALMFNSKNEDLNAEDVYSKLTTPVFGKGVAYDVPNHVSHFFLHFSVCLMSCSDKHSLYSTAGFSGTEEDVQNWTEHCSF